MGGQRQIATIIEREGLTQAEFSALLVLKHLPLVM